MLASQRFECKRCGFKCGQKSDLQRHLNRKHPCKPVLEDITCEDLLKDLTKEKEKCCKCDKCGKGFTARSSKSRHMKNCTVVPPPKISEESIIQLQAEVAALKRELLEVKNRPPVSYNNTGVINNIVIHNRGNEDTRYLDWDDLTTCLMNQDMPHLIKLIHCNPDHLENANIRMKNRKDRLMEQFVDGRWIVTQQEEVLTKLVHDGYQILYKHYKANESELDEEYIDDICSWLCKLREEDASVITPIHKQLVLLFLNRDVYVLQK